MWFPYKVHRQRCTCPHVLAAASQVAKIAMAISAGELPELVRSNGVRFWNWLIPMHTNCQSIVNGVKTHGRRFQFIFETRTMGKGSEFAATKMISRLNILRESKWIFFLLTMGIFRNNGRACIIDLTSMVDATHCPFIFICIPLSTSDALSTLTESS